MTKIQMQVLAQYGAAAVANPKKIVFVRSGAFIESFGSCAKVIERCLGKKYHNIEKDPDKAPVFNVGIPAHEQSRTVERLTKMGFSVLVIEQVK